MPAKLKDSIPQMEELGLTVLAVKPEDQDKLYGAIDLLAQATNTVARGEELKSAIEDNLLSLHEAIGDAENPLADITTIDDDANALAAFEEIHCWTHWLMIFGALVTIVYGLAVLYRRRHGIRDMDDFEGDIMGGRKYDAAAEKNPAAGNAFQAM